MKIVIVASSPDCDTAKLHTLLQASGLPAARPSAKYSQTAADWHSKIYSAQDHNIDGLSTHAALPVGIAWLELAVDLLVSNMDQNEWGFADPRATWLLDFWRNVDPQTRFVLAYTPPQHLDLTHPQALATWLSYSAELLRFYKANPTRTLLVDHSEVGIYPARLAYTCQKMWSLATVNWQQLGTVAAAEPPPTFYPVPSAAAKLGKLLHLARTPLLNPSTAVMSTKKQGKPPGMLGALFALFGKSKQLKEDLDRAHAELGQAHSELNQAKLLLTDLGQDKENLQTHAQDLKSQVQDLQAHIDRLQAHVKSLEANLATQLASAQALQGQLKELQAHHQALQATSKAHAEEGELLLSQLHQVQEELERYALPNKQVQEQLAKTVAAEAALKTQLDNVAKALEAKSNDLAAKAKELADAQAAAQTASAAAHTASAAAQAAAAKAKQEADAAASAAKAQLDAKAKELADKNNELAAKAKQLADAQAAAQSASAAAQAAAAKAKQEADAALSAVKAERDKQAQLVQQAQAKHQDSAQENELLLLQLMQAQEELVEYYEQKGEFEKLYLAYKSRWDRLETRLPNYLDFGAVDIAHVDSLSDIPSITWQVKDFAQAGLALSEFSFVTVLQDGQPGIGLVKAGQGDPAQQVDSANPPHAVQPGVFVPKLLNTHKDQLNTFLGLGTQEFRQLTAAVSILSQLDAAQWQGVALPPQFDLGFWRASLQTLIAQLKTLPALLRYDDVRLKRELINPDYEHLWLEFHGLSLGASHWKKFEIRLGAALVQANGFSQYPKFEIPLIDGKTKPFESWYAESQDDSGAKLELRFSLDKNAFDVAVWAKLSDADKAVLARIIYAMPDALKRLEAQKTSIHRPWASWVSFASDAVRVLERNRTEPAKIAPSAAPAKPTQVINVAATPASAPKPAPNKYAASKTVAAKPARKARA